MRKIFVLFGILLVIGLLSGCSSDEDVPDVIVPQYGDSVLIYAVGHNEVKAVYEPVPYQDNPEWIKQIIDGEGIFYFLFLNVYKGERDVDVVYFISSDSSNSIGDFYDENGKRLIIETDYLSFFSETNNWKQIYYYNYKMKYKSI